MIRAKALVFKKRSMSDAVCMHFCGCMYLYDAARFGRDSSIRSIEKQGDNCNHFIHSFSSSSLLSHWMKRLVLSLNSLYPDNASCHDINASSSTRSQSYQVVNATTVLLCKAGQRCVTNLSHALSKVRWSAAVLTNYKAKKVPCYSYNSITPARPA